MPLIICAGAARRSGGLRRCPRHRTRYDRGERAPPALAARSDAFHVVRCSRLLGAFPPPALSLRWYATFFSDPYLLKGLKTSVELAIALLSHGVFPSVPSSGHIYLSFVHTDTDLSDILGAMRNCLERYPFAEGIKECGN